MADSASTDPVVARLLHSVQQRTLEYFAQEFGVHFECTPAHLLQSAALNETSAVIGLKGAVNQWIAFSPVPTLSTLIYAQMTQGFEVAPEEVAQFRDAAMAEMANTVLGHCTADLQAHATVALPMTPPTVLAAAKQIQSRGGAQLHGLRLSTATGHLDILVAGPAELFRSNLDYLE